MLLRELVEKDHVLFRQRVSSWEESITLSCSTLVADGTVDPAYAQEIIDCVRTYGPYIVLIPGFAMPHSTQDSRLAHGTGIGFLKLEEAVDFDPKDPDKKAKVFFALSATDKDAHMDNMQRLFQMLSNEELCSKLLQVRNTGDLLRLDQEYGKD